MVDAFAATYGGPGEVVIAVGDWSLQLHYPKFGKWHERGKMPSQTMGIVDAFRARGYTIGFIDESYTSQDCSKCDGKSCCDFFTKTRRQVRVRKHDPSSPMTNRVVKTLVRCAWCRTIFDRDFNAARNIYKKALELRGP
uniref:Cas12f1-like TNB domain-containing protein n=2 Tax=Diacronema lutheri TaxID=2081491 RepID=A0A7R9UN46_DIALT